MYSNPLAGLGGGGGTGPIMFFVELVPEEAPNGKAWEFKDIEALNKRWRAVR